MEKTTTYPSFGCCAFWKQCQMGKLKEFCKYAEQPKMYACYAYQKHHDEKVKALTQSILKRRENKNVTTTVVKELEFEVDQFNQLKLF